MLLDSIHSDSFSRVGAKQASQEVEEFVRSREVLDLHLLLRVLDESAVMDVGALIECESSIAEQEEHLPHGKNIYWGSGVRLVLSSELRRHVLISSALSHQGLLHGTLEDLH